MGARAAEGLTADEAITVDNSIIFRDVAPGARLEVEIVVKNQTPFAAELVSRVEDVSRYEGGGAAVRLAQAGSTDRSAAAWISAEPSSFALASIAERPVRLTFTVPERARPGGYYVALVYTATQAGADRQPVRVDAEIPVYVLLTVTGDMQRGLEARLQPRDAWRWTGGAATWDLELHNSGDVHENVSGRVEIDGLFAGARSASVNAGVLLPGERRSQAVELELRGAPDLFAAGVSIERDDAPDATAEAGRTVVLPWWLLVLVLAAMLVVTWRLRARHRSDDEMT